MSTELKATWCEGSVIARETAGSAYQLLELEAEGAEASEPGQFYLLGLGPREPLPNDPLLLRPMSVLWAETSRLQVLFKIAGRGTRMLASVKPGETLRLLGPLGRPFTRASEPPPLLIGGGVGLPPLHYLSRVLSTEGVAHRVIFGFNTATEIPRELLSQLDQEAEICTMDGSAGWEGNPLAYLERETDRPPARLQACGPLGLLDALRARRREIDELELSLEERMACGVGICRGCVVPVRDDAGGWRYETVCREGPVFDVETLYDGADAKLNNLVPEACDLSRDGGESDA